MNQGDIILLSLRDYQDEKGDVILKYSADEARSLKAYGELPETAKINETDTYVFVFLLRPVTIGGNFTDGGVADMDTRMRMTTWSSTRIGITVVMTKILMWTRFEMVVSSGMGGCELLFVRGELSGRVFKTL